VHLRFHPDAATFLDAAGPALRADPLANQMPLGVADAIRYDPRRYGDAVRMCTVHADDGAVIGALLHTPPWLPGLSAMPLDAAAFAGAAYAAAHPDVNGAFGRTEAALAFAAAAYGVRAAVEPAVAATLLLDGAMGLFALTAVAELPRAAGGRRPATPDDAALLHTWLLAFHDEAIPTEPPLGPTAGATAAARGTGHFWVEAGDPVAYATYGRSVEGWVSIGPVYTPPEHRGRGYATSLVAEMSAAALAEGRVGCTLFTDLANPTSNAIYERIGYRRVGTMARYAIR
jgi:RimJ/RimL family protein N-acetyltransferase